MSRMYGFISRMLLEAKIRVFFQNSLSCKHQLNFGVFFPVFVALQTTSSNENLPPEITFEKEPPPIEWHLAACSNDFDMFNILTVSQFEF